MDRVLHLELVEQTATALQLRFWSASQDPVRVRTLAPDEIHDLIRLAETDYYSAYPLRLRETGERLFRWLDGGERWLSTAIREAENQARLVVLAIASPHGLAHLPWELLHDGAEFLVQALNPPVLPVRWRPVQSESRTPGNRPLQLLFMASSPESTRNVLDFEQEEHAILTATRRWPLDLTVEESGCLDELDALLQDHGPGFFDVLHLSGHAGHGRDRTPYFVLEDGEGGRVQATAHQLARTLFHRPPLVFLSGCRTGQNPGDGEIRSLAEQLVANGFRAVLGWARPVQDTDAIRAARHLYQHLSAGNSVTESLVRVHARLRDEGVRDWHLLRLFVAGEPPVPLVTPLRTPGRRYAVGRPAESEFLDPRTKAVRVATRAGFVGRRRLLQSGVRTLRARDTAGVGLLLHGQGGRGKSSVAARLCDRLRRDYQRVVVVGRLDEASLLNAWTRELLDDHARRVLRDPAVDLALRIELTLHHLAECGRPAPLFVLDDFEQNQPGAAGGDLALAPPAHAVLSALADALAHAGVGRLLITCRYVLPPPFDGLTEAAGVPPLDEVARRKQLLRLERGAGPRARDAGALEDAVAVADGNPRLLEWLHAVIGQPRVDAAAILDAMRAVEERFREDILARHLVASLSEEARVLLGRLLLLDAPVPLAAVRLLAAGDDDDVTRRSLDRAGALGLLDVTEEDGEPHFRVPRQLAGTVPPLLPEPGDAVRGALCDALFELLYDAWWVRRTEAREGRTLQLIRLGVQGGRADPVAVLARSLTDTWLTAHRYAEAEALLASLLAPTRRHPALLLNAARARQSLGDGAASGALFTEALERSAGAVDELRAVILFRYTEWLMSQGRGDDVIRIGRTELIPLLANGRAWREVALTQGRIADVLQSRGELDEALRIRREEELPVYERVGDVRSRAVTLGKVADVLYARGELDEVLRILRDEELPAYELLDDARDRALTLGRIADVLAVRGDLDEALRIRRDEELPVYERLGDARSRAVTLGRVADILRDQGALDEVLRIRRDEELPVYERLGDARERAKTLGKIADVLYERGQVDEALRLLRDEVVPVFERLGDVRSRALAQCQVADALEARGELDEALRIGGRSSCPCSSAWGTCASGR